MTNYTYNDIATSPNTDQIHVDVAASAMDDKNIVGCRWDKDIETLVVRFQNELSGADETILNGIVANNS